MSERTSHVRLAERVAELACGLGIETAIIGGYALGLYNYYRNTVDLDLATVIQTDRLQALGRAAEDAGLKVRFAHPVPEEVLGGTLCIFERVDEDGEALEPVEVVNFFNTLAPRKTPATDAIRGSLPISDSSPLRYVQLPDLIALKLFANGFQDHADVLNLLKKNPAADLEAIRRACEPYALSAKLEELIAAAAAGRR